MKSEMARIPHLTAAILMMLPLLPFLPLHAHDVSGLGYDTSAKPPGAVAPGWFQGKTNAADGLTNAAAPKGAGSVPEIAAVFAPFAPGVTTFRDDRFLYVQSTGLPRHGLMVGITNWQQQIPVPQDYSGPNAWRLPLNPEPSDSPVSIRGRFLRGAIAIAANGVPIFNPQNNRGEISAQIGELDQWGGHCGRADDYLYHAAPLHLQEQVGSGRPIAVAMDGYPIQGLTETDGSTPKGLDELNGHWSKELGYHYHASTSYPYVNGGFHGEVTEAGGQVDPQPSAHPFRPAGRPLPGAVITGFERSGQDSYRLIYELGGEKHEILYSLGTNSVLTVEYRNGADGTNSETYLQRKGGGPGRPEGPPPQPQKPDAPVAASRTTPTPGTTTTVGLKLHSPVVGADGLLPVEFTGDGAGISPPLSWSGAPAGTRAYALIMHHLDPEGKTKWYWILYNIPAGISTLAKNEKGVGTFGGNSVNREVGYAPPHSKGYGPKTYVITLYALSQPLELGLPADQVTRETLLAAMKGKVLTSSELPVVYSRKESVSATPGAPGWEKKDAGHRASPPNPDDEPKVSSPLN